MKITRVFNERRINRNKKSRLQKKENFDSFKAFFILYNSERKNKRRV